MAVQEEKAPKHAERKQWKADHHKDLGIEQVGIPKNEKQKSWKGKLHKVAVPQWLKRTSPLLIRLDDHVSFLVCHHREYRTRAWSFA
jgi:hypothetical protein